MLGHRDIYIYKSPVWRLCFSPLVRLVFHTNLKYPPSCSHSHSLVLYLWRFGAPYPCPTMLSLFCRISLFVPLSKETVNVGFLMRNGDRSSFGSAREVADVFSSNPFCQTLCYFRKVSGYIRFVRPRISCCQPTLSPYGYGGPLEGTRFRWSRQVESLSTKKVNCIT